MVHNGQHMGVVHAENKTEGLKIAYRLLSIDKTKVKLELKRYGETHPTPKRRTYAVIVKSVKSGGK